MASFEEVRSRQYTHLRGVIAKAPSVSTACVADLVSSLDPSVWEHAQIEELKALLANKLGGVGKERRPMQDYVCLPLYLDQSVWNMLHTTSEQGERFERLCRHAIALGMRCPAEYHRSFGLVGSVCLSIANGCREAETAARLQAKVEEGAAGFTGACGISASATCGGRKLPSCVAGECVPGRVFALYSAWVVL
jgi:hypothetical protein